MIICVRRLPEDDPVVPKYVGVMLITKRVLWFVSYCTLLWVFVVQYTERFQGLSRGISQFVNTPVYAGTPSHTRDTTARASHICYSPTLILRHFAKEPISVTVAYLYLSAVVVRWMVANSSSQAVIDRTSLRVTRTDTPVIFTPGCRHRVHEIAIRLIFHKCNNKHQ